MRFKISQKDFSQELQEPQFETEKFGWLEKRGSVEFQDRKKMISISEVFHGHI